MLTLMVSAIWLVVGFITILFRVVVDRKYKQLMNDYAKNPDSFGGYKPPSLPSYIMIYTLLGGVTLMMAIHSDFFLKKDEDTNKKSKGDSNGSL